MRGLGSKHKRFFCSSSSYDYGIIILTETWLKNTFYDAEYFDDTFSVYRKDRSKRRGGGVLIALNNNIFSSEQIEIDGAENIEYVCIKAKIKTQTIFIYNAYIPPNSPASVYDSHLSAINLIASNPEDLIIIAGDFNLPKVQWAYETDDDNVLLPTAFNPPHSSDFINGLISRGLYQVNGIRNVKNRLLDLFFTNDFLNVTVNQANPLVKIDEYHPPLLIEYEWHSNWSSESTNVQRMYKMYNECTTLNEPILWG